MSLEAESSSGEGVELVTSLHKWLLADSDVADASVSLKQRETLPGTMSGGLEILSAITDQVATYGNLVIAYLTWRNSRRNDETTDLRVTIERGGETIQIDNLTDDQLRGIIQNPNRSEG